MIKSLKKLGNNIFLNLEKIKDKHILPQSLLQYLNKSIPINFVDIGAHNGDFTKAIANHCGISKGLLIEPIPEKAIHLCRTFRNSKYLIFECVLSSDNGFIDFEINDFQPTSSILKIKHNMPELNHIKVGSSKTISCKKRTLDDVVEEAKFDKIDLIKLDVQGAEHLVINGASKALSITSMIWTEVSFKPLYEQSSTFFEIYSLITQAGFKLLEIEPGFRGPDGELLQSDVLFVKR